jgi:hypothetical protein
MAGGSADGVAGGEGWEAVRKKIRNETNETLIAV